MANDPLVKSRNALAAQENQLLIDQAALDNELIQHSQRYYSASKEHSLAASYRDEAKMALSESEARADVGIRESASKDGAARVTEGQIKARIDIDETVKAARKKLLDWSLLESQWRALTVAIQDRRWAISDLVKLKQIEYYDASLKDGDARVMGSLAADRVRNAG